MKGFKAFRCEKVRKISWEKALSELYGILFVREDSSI